MGSTDALAEWRPDDVPARARRSLRMARTRRRDCTCTPFDVARSPASLDKILAVDRRPQRDRAGSVRVSWRRQKAARRRQLLVGSQLRLRGAATTGRASVVFIAEFEGVALTTCRSGEPASAF